VDLAVALLSRRVEHQRDAADFPFELLVPGRVVVGEDQRLFVQQAGLTVAGLSAAALEAVRQCRSMLPDDEERAASEQAEQKLLPERHHRAEVSVGDQHCVGANPFEQRRQQRAFLRVTTLAGHEFHDQFGLRIQQRERLSGQRSLPRGPQHLQTMLGRCEMIAVEILCSYLEASAASQLNLRLDGGQLAAGVVDFHLPIDAALGRVHVG